MKFTHLTLSCTPVGTPKEREAARELFCETFFSAPYSNIAPNVPALKITMIMI